MSYLDLLCPDVRRMVDDYCKWNQYDEINWSLFNYIFDKHINAATIWDHDDFPQNFAYIFADKMQAILDRHRVEVKITIHYERSMLESMYYTYGLNYERRPFVPDAALIELFLFFLRAKCRETPMYQSKLHRQERIIRRVDIMNEINTQCQKRGSTLRVVMYDVKTFEVQHINGTPP